MIDLKLLRDHPEAIREAIRRRGLTMPLDGLLTVEKRRRELITSIEQARQELKRGSEAFARQKAKGHSAPPAALKQLSDRITQQEQQLKQVEEEVQNALALLPNIPHVSVPAGDARQNQVVRTVGKPAAFSFLPKTHMELGVSRGLLDLERAAKITGSHFPLFTGQGARLVRALIQWMLDVQTKEHGYTEVWPPALVNRPSMFSTGQLPKFEEDMYRLKDDDLFLIPTAEVPVTNLHRDEVLDEAQLPLKYTAYTPCFRREAGSYGKETKGLVRVHQFDKVELVKFATPETSYAEHERLVQNAEVILRRLGLHYRVVCLAAGDLSFAAAKCYDLEAWAPGLNQFLEVSSCSNFEAFQARRANIRYRKSGSKKPEFVHTLNGSGVALARTVICLLETHQQPDGKIRIPEPLRPYFDGQDQI
ncbi:MAG: serine--tRNA ligase [Candidatus Omnitrophica bacterium]|nr:serine--tRNA ligase [Candidatus Omnitrophota bacterium]